MVTLIIGGSGSGKSEYAENMAVSYSNTSLYYLATMQPFDQESLDRIKRHQTMRSEKNFKTIECFTGVHTIQLPEKSTLLLECMSNLVANEMFSEHGAKHNALEEIKKGILHIMDQTQHLIVVTNHVFSDGYQYDPVTEEYLTILGNMNQWLGSYADQVIQVICGIPFVIKEEKVVS